MTTVAIVPAYERADRVGATVGALLDVDGVDEVVVVDDGSSDTTSIEAAAAGASVVRLRRNRGKGGAVQAGVESRPDADVYLLVDADVGTTAEFVAALADPVRAGDADMTVAVLPPAGTRGGFGRIRRIAGAGIKRATGFETRAPLSGQRAVRGELLRSMTLAGRFGLEVGMTIDALRAGARVIEIDVPMDHRHTGRTVSGFRHRARQGSDVIRALWPRLTTPLQRVCLIALAAIVAATAMMWSGGRWEAASVASTRRADRVVIVGVPHLSWDDVETGRLPRLDALIDTGAVAASSVRTLAGRPSPAEAYATLGAGTRVLGGDAAGLAYAADEAVEAGTAASAAGRRTGLEPRGEVVVVGLPGIARANKPKHVSSYPGALGDALRASGKSTAVIGNADTGVTVGRRGPILRPAAIALAGTDGTVDEGEVGPGLLVNDPTAPFGLRSDLDAMLAAFDRTTADVVLIDSGDLDRVAVFDQLATPGASAAARSRALADSDRLLGAIVDRVSPETLLLVVSVVPPGGEWHLAPIVASGAGVVHGSLFSPSTRRRGLVTLTDVAPTVLDALGVATPAGMIGHPLRYHAETPDVGGLADMDRDAGYREGIYFRLTIGYIVAQAIVYILAMLAFTRFGGVGRAGPWLRAVVLGVSAWPLATFAHRAIPDVAELGGVGVVLLFAIDAAIVALALRARRHALSPLSWVVGATVALFLVDVATGARLQSSSILGYSPHTAARFTGLGNASFAALAATAVIAGALHVHHAPRRREALFGTAAIFGLVVIADGWPSLGADVGGIITLVPVFALTLIAMSGRRISWRSVAIVAALAVAVVGVAALVDVARPPESRTHLGRLVADVNADGVTPFSTTVSRKLATNFRTWKSPWTWSILVLSGYLIWFVVWAGGWSRQLPARGALRAGAVGVLAAGLLGYASNDSGVVVAAARLRLSGAVPDAGGPRRGRRARAHRPARTGAGMTVAASLVAGFLAGRLTWMLLRGTLASERFVAVNLRGNPIATAGGLVVVLAVLTVEGGRAASGWPPDAGRAAVLAAVVGFALLGLLDDLAGGGDARGFRGHLASLARGRLTTGGAKLLGGAAVAVIAVATVAPSGPGRSSLMLLADGALVALAANLANLLDRAPGRVIKASAGALAVLVAATRAAPSLAPVVLAAAAALAIALDDLHERVMLGDTGANALGGVLGLGVVMTGSTTTRLATLAVVAGLNLVAEVVSFSRVIESVAPLRAIDRAGRLR